MSTRQLVPTTDESALERSRSEDGGPRLSRMLVATDGGPSAEPALRIAMAIAAGNGASVALLSVFMPRVPIPPGPSQRQWRCEAPDRPQVTELARRVRRQRRDVGPASLRWPIRIAVGNPASVIARTARDEDVDLVIVGLGRADPNERFRGDETVLQLALSTTVPVLAVAAGATDQPRNAIIAVDSMDDVDRRTIGMAVTLLAQPSMLHLALTRSSAIDAEAAVQAAREAGAVDSVAVFASPRRAEGGAIVDLARDVDADLIAAPMHGRTPEERMVIQDLVVPLLRSAHCSVLAVPPVGHD